MRYRHIPRGALVAKFRTTCAVCKTAVTAGSPIGRMPTGRWGHVQCAAYARRNREERGSRYQYRGRA